mgnify:CR=1 FL=1
MDTVLSARVDESVARKITELSKQLKTTKKAVIEQAIEAFAASVAEQAQTDFLAATAGAWQREESVEQTVADAREAFRDGMSRHVIEP